MMLEQVMDRDRPRLSDYVKVESSSTSQYETKRRYHLKQDCSRIEKLVDSALFSLQGVPVGWLDPLD